jgi:hypothetical protein
MNTNLSLAAGSLAAVLTVLGAGELFRKHTASQTLWGIPRLSTVSLLVLAVLLPLLLRFFVRTILSYNNLLRFNRLQKACLAFIDGRSAWQWVELERRTYLDQWKSPKSLKNLVWHNLEYGFFWIFVVAATAFAWALATSPGTTPRAIAGGLVVLGSAWEVVTLRTSRKWFFTLPTIGVRSKLEEFEKHGDSFVDSEATPVPRPADAAIEVASGIFVGWRRLLRPPRDET